MRPLASVTGTRCTRWTPRSNFNRLQAPRPCTKKITSLSPPTPVGLESITSTFQRCASAYFVYIRARSAANSAASSPPAPARISTKTFLSSFGSLGSTSVLSSSSSPVCRADSSSISAWASSASSRSPPSARMWRASPKPSGPIAVRGEALDDLDGIGVLLPEPGVLGGPAEDGGVGQRPGDLVGPLFDVAELVKQHRGSGRPFAGTARRANKKPAGIQPH